MIASCGIRARRLRIVENTNAPRNVNARLPASPAPPPPEGPVELGPETAEAVNGALSNGTPVLVAYVDATGQAQLSYRGSTQVFGSDQLAMWIRDPAGGLPEQPGWGGVS